MKIKFLLIILVMISLLSLTSSLVLAEGQGMPHEKNSLQGDPLDISEQVESYLNDFDTERYQVVYLKPSNGQYTKYLYEEVFRIQITGCEDHLKALKGYLEYQEVLVGKILDPVEYDHSKKTFLMIFEVKTSRVKSLRERWNLTEWERHHEDINPHLDCSDDDGNHGGRGGYSNDGDDDLSTWEKYLIDVDLNPAPAPLQDYYIQMIEDLNTEIMVIRNNKVLHFDKVELERLERLEREREVTRLFLQDLQEGGNWVAYLNRKTIIATLVIIISLLAIGYRIKQAEAVY